ncbi:MAG: PqqD family protein [Lachnospiraceae bacterium]|nr:PqqD family protein [Lachnospiraceae bacterium]
MKIKPGFLLRNIGNENIIVPLKTQTFYRNKILKINEIGAFLFKLMECEISEEELVTNIINEYDVDISTAKQDIAELLHTFTEKGLLE